MRTLKKYLDNEIHPIWGSSFIKGIPREVERLNESMGLDLEFTVNQPVSIDGETSKAENVVFVIKKRPWFLSETYCLYGILCQSKNVLYEGVVLKGYVGKMRGNEIKTLKELGSVENLEKGNIVLSQWIQALIKATCDKV